MPQGSPSESNRSQQCRNPTQHGRDRRRRFGPGLGCGLVPQAADHGIARTQFSYGYLLEHGQGVAQNYFDAARYYQSAANQNFASAENNLGMMYEQGRGVTQDQQRALLLYQSAANHGDNGGRQNAQQVTNGGKRWRKPGLLLRQRSRRKKNANRRSPVYAATSKGQEGSANSSETSAENLANTNSCSGAAGAICQTIANAGAAKQRQKANDARNKADDDRSEIERLEGLEVLEHQPIWMQ
jgi:TPR repeat protein